MNQEEAGDLLDYIEYLREFVRVMGVLAGAATSWKRRAWQRRTMRAMCLRHFCLHIMTEPGSLLCHRVEGVEGLN